MEMNVFTPRQRDVIIKMCKGKSNKEIARTLGMAESTVKIHLTEIFKEMGVTNRARAIIVASDFPVTNDAPVPLTDLDILKEFTNVTFSSLNNQWHERVLKFGYAIENKAKSL